MRTRLRFPFAAGALILMLAAGPVLAHHAFSSEFDAAKPVKLTGTVKKMEWINPHSWLTLEVKNPNGTTETWEIEAGAPNAMFRRGFNKNSLPVGTQVVVNGFQAKDGRKRANGRDLSFPDGRRLFLGSSGTGAPEDGRDTTRP
jgi:Family of unknown function (DUF6152)